MSVGRVRHGQREGVFNTNSIFPTAIALTRRWKRGPIHQTRSHVGGARSRNHELRGTGVALNADSAALRGLRGPNKHDDPAESSVAPYPELGGSDRVARTAGREAGSGCQSLPRRTALRRRVLALSPSSVALAGCQRPRAVARRTAQAGGRGRSGASTGELTERQMRLPVSRRTRRASRRGPG